MSEALNIDRILEYSGFDESSQLTIIVENGFGGCDGILMLGDSDIVSLAKDFSEGTVDTGEIIFGLHRTNLLKATIHWAQDFRRISRTPSLFEIRKAAVFCTVVVAAR